MSIPTIYLKSECCKNFTFIEHLMQDTSNWDSQVSRVNDYQVQIQKEPAVTK